MAATVLPILAAILALGVVVDRAQAQDKPRILMLTQSAGFKHGSVNRDGRELSVAEVAMIDLGNRTGEFSVRCTQNAEADFTPKILQDFEIVMFYTTGKLPIAEEDLNYFFKEWLIQKGHGFIGVHSATDTYGDYEPYWDMVGGTFDGHPWGAGSHVTIAVHDPDHPTMKPFGSEFQVQDEIYQYKHWQPEKVRVLMSLDMAKTELKRPYHVPVAWVKQIGEGRMYYNNLGHREETWQNEAFLKSLVAAVRWIAGKEEGDATPNPEQSEAQQEVARKAVANNP
ncbi:MAG: ThuA domain-containing protein [Planctomycetales bacterium]|nr:ThuA domain-containing protein [Planctomycetales bacterium]